jgi:hypothetical protein
VSVFCPHDAKIRIPPIAKHHVDDGSRLHLILVCCKHTQLVIRGQQMLSEFATWKNILIFYRACPCHYNYADQTTYRQVTYCITTQLTRAYSLGRSLKQRRSNSTEQTAETKSQLVKKKKKIYRNLWIPKLIPVFT